MDDEHCQNNWTGGTGHFWSTPDASGAQECLFCRVRRRIEFLVSSAPIIVGLDGECRFVSCDPDPE
jgi:hypothetical protein